MPSTSTYHVIITGSPHGRPGTWCADNGRSEFPTREDADAFRDHMASIYPAVDYRTVRIDAHSPSFRLELLDHVSDYYSRNPTIGDPVMPVMSDDDDDEDDDEDEFVECPDCGHYDVDDCYHEFYYCGDCGWGCEAPDCDECLSWSERFGDLLCGSCYHEYERSETGSPGRRVRTCSTCSTGDRHHDEIIDEFLCDHRARRSIAEGHVVRLAYPLPTLEVA